MGGLFDLDSLQEKIANNEHLMMQPDFWSNPTQAQQVIQTTNLLKSQYDDFQDLRQQVADAQVACDLLESDPQDQDLLQDLTHNLTKLNSDLQAYEISMLLNRPYDQNNALLEIHPGAGGTESQDWGAMLLRMYERWAEHHQFQIEVEDYQPGEEAGLKSVTLLIKGHNAYGLLRSEHGVHRLVRISPFDAAGRRHTSFASVEVMPELDDNIEVEIHPEDLRIDVFRASGAGGQHINKTSSAVRITHLPTGIVVSSQAQRSQLQNRETALSMLRSKLYQRQLVAQEQHKAELKGEQLDIGWGSQIRSYVFHPYTMVKDHRTNYETGNGQAVMDGTLDPFIYAYLQWQLQQSHSQ